MRCCKLLDFSLIFVVLGHVWGQLGIFNVHVQRPLTTKLYPNRINSAELWRHVDLSRWRLRRGNSTSDFVFGDFAQIGRSKSTCIPNFGWDITTSCFLKRTSAMLEFYFPFRFWSSWSSHHHHHNTLHQPAKLYVNRTTHSRVTTS